MPAQTAPRPAKTIKTDTDRPAKPAGKPLKPGEGLKQLSETWQKATANLPDEWVKDVSATGQDGKMLLQAATELIKKYDTAK